jgi:hypothetical protein
MKAFSGKGRSLGISKFTSVGLHLQIERGELCRFAAVTTVTTVTFVTLVTWCGTR